MARSCGVGEMAEWFKAAVLKPLGGRALKPSESRISNEKWPRISRTPRRSQRFAMAHRSAHNMAPASWQASEGRTSKPHGGATVAKYRFRRIVKSYEECRAKRDYGTCRMLRQLSSEPGQRCCEGVGYYSIKDWRWVYFIGAKPDGPVKIGIARDPFLRLAELQVANAADLEILTTCTGGKELEQHFHARFRAHRIRGEWFLRSPEIVAEIEEQRREQGL